MGKGGGARRVDPRDRAQLAESPVPLRRVLALFRPHIGRLTLVVLVIVESSLVALGQPFLIRALVDRAIPEGNRPLLLLCVLGLLTVAAGNGLLGIIQAWLTTSTGQAVMSALRTRVFDHLQRQSMDFFTRTHGGEIQSRLTNDIGGLQAVVTNTATSIVTSLTTVTATLVAMLALSPRLTLLTAFVLPPALLLTRRVAHLRRDMTVERQRTLSALTGQIHESLSISGAMLTRTLGIAPLRSRQFARSSEELADLEVRSRMAGRGRLATMDFAFAAIPALVFLAAGYPEVVGPLSLGTIIAFTALQAGIFRPLMNLLNVGADWVASMALLSRIFGYLDLPVEVAEPTHPVRVDPAAVRGEVAIDGVSYRYPSVEGNVLTGIDLHIPAGGSAALVGETGSGKSTLGNLIARLADPSTGRITIDGVDVRHLAFEDLTRIVGMVNQNPYLVHTSIRENLLLARPAATNDELWAVLAAAQIDDLVRSLPDGLDTVVGSQGHRLSGGEKQRIAIARTLLKDPRVLILDEATSALDNRTEHDLQVALDALTRGRTTVTIAHRLSTIRDADTIHVLDSGRVVERGSFDDLLLAGGAFAHLALDEDSRSALSGAEEPG